MVPMDSPMIIPCVFQPTHVTPCWCYDRMWGAV